MTKQDYYETHALPYLIEHLKMRAVGMQFFTAIQAGLLVAWASKSIWYVSLLGLASCVSFWIWDQRNRYIFRSLHELGVELFDKDLFPDGKGKGIQGGMHRFLLTTLKQSGKIFTLTGFASHTWAIRIINLSAMLLWILIVAGMIQ